jgi:hypothetical protein
MSTSSRLFLFLPAGTSGFYGPCFAFPWGHAARSSATAAISWLTCWSQTPKSESQHCAARETHGFYQRPNPRRGAYEEKQ